MKKNEIRSYKMYPVPIAVERFGRKEQHQRLRCKASSLAQRAERERLHRPKRLQSLFRRSHSPKRLQSLFQRLHSLKRLQSLFQRLHRPKRLQSLFQRSYSPKCLQSLSRRSYSPKHLLDPQPRASVRTAEMHLYKTQYSALTAVTE